MINKLEQKKNQLQIKYKIVFKTISDYMYLPTDKALQTPLYTRMLCAKFGLSSSVVLEKRNCFYIFTIYAAINLLLGIYLALLSNKNYSHFHQMMLCASRPSTWFLKVINVSIYIISPWRTIRALLNETSHPFTQGTLCHV